METYVFVTRRDGVEVVERDINTPGAGSRC